MSHTQSEVSLPNVHPMLRLAIVIVDGRVCFFFPWFQNSWKEKISGK